MVHQGQYSVELTKNLSATFRSGRSLALTAQRDLLMVQEREGLVRARQGSDKDRTLNSQSTAKLRTEP